jgi:hypothetical protein
MKTGLRLPRRRHARFLWLAWLIATIASPLPLRAIPNSFFGNGNAPVIVIPAFPRFGSDLTEEFLNAETWRSRAFSGPWREEPAAAGESLHRMTANPVLLGEVPMTVVRRESDSGVGEIAIHYLDAGLYFGYRAGGERTREERDAGKDRRAEFRQHYQRLERSLKARLEEGCGRGQSGVLGAHPALRTPYTDYRWEDFVLRFVPLEGHSLSIHLYPAGAAPQSLVEPAWTAASRRERQAHLRERVRRDPGNGALRLVGLPVATQGLTPFCGVQSLAMASGYLGLRASPEQLAAAAEFKNTGSAAGGDLIGLHRAVAGELGMKVSMAPNWDTARVERSLAEGLPVIVWRRVSLEREQGHARAARSDRALEAAGEERAPLARLEPDELRFLPAKGERGSPSHASVVIGIDTARGEVLYCEPWGEDGRDRRMRLEEMEATAYAHFYFRL